MRPARDSVHDSYTADLRAHADDIDSVAAKGPDATNTEMPELGGGVTSRPSDAERARLGEYLACLQAP